MKYVLMHKDIEVLKFNYDEFELINCAYLPFGLRQDSLTTQKIYNWVVNRLNNLQRVNMDKICVLREIDGTIDSQIRDSYGVSAIDKFWIKIEGQEVTWNWIQKNKDINMSLNKVALMGEVVKDKDYLNGITSLYSLKGYFQKSVDNEYLYKAFEISFLEYPAYLIGKQLDIKISECSIERDCVKIKLFTNDNISLVHAIELKQLFNTEELYQYFKSIKRLDIVEDMQKMFIFNYIIGNPDLHEENYGYLYNSETFEILELAPCYDHNVAFQEGFTGISRVKNVKMTLNSLIFQLDEFAKILIGNHKNIVKNLKCIDLTEVKKYLTKRQFEELLQRVKICIDWGSI